jgi:twitching motility protein PilI
VISDPTSILKNIEGLCRLTATCLPQKTRATHQWSGVAFRIGGSRMVAVMGEVVEIMTYPELSVVPNTCSWVRGIANVRGRLLPVIDMNGYLYGRLAPIGKRTRVMVAECQGIYSGLVVDEVMGLRHFPEGTIVAEPSLIEEALRPYVHQGFSVDGEQWGIFRLMSLVESPQFLHAAA